MRPSPLLRMSEMDEHSSIRGILWRKLWSPMPDKLRNLAVWDRSDINKVKPVLDLALKEK